MRLRLKQDFSVVSAAAVTMAALGLIGWRVTSGGGDKLSQSPSAADVATTADPGASPTSGDRAGHPIASGGGNVSGGPTPGMPTPAPSACGPNDVVATLSTDKATYQPGDTVWVSMQVTYRGTGKCSYGGGCVPFVTVQDSSGHRIPTTMAPPNCGRYPPLTLHQSSVLVERYPWDQQPLNSAGSGTTGTEVPRGAYTLTGDWHALGLTNTVTIQLA